MRRINLGDAKSAASGWAAAIQLTSQYLAENRKASQLLADLPDSFVGEARARCQSLFLGALRHGFRVRDALRPHLRHPPGRVLEAALLVAGAELIESAPGLRPKIVHHAVEQAKRFAPARDLAFLNAVLRRLPEALDRQDPERAPAVWFSHPAWLVDRWTACFGPEAARRLLEWNQGIPDTFLRIYGARPVPEGLSPTPWPGFHRVEKAGALRQEPLAALLAAGEAYVKDPSTRLAPELLAPAAGERVLDLCAAPGGKAFDLARAMGGRGLLVAVDLPGERMPRLRENLAKLESKDFQAVPLESDLLELDRSLLEARGLPAAYDAVMLDAPCSNTGVIRRRTDVKWRLQPGDIAACAKLQQQLIHSAARFVASGGRLVYSTCSIEADENRAIVDDFLASDSGRPFRLSAEVRCLPWDCGHDGATAFRLDRD